MTKFNLEVNKFTKIQIKKIEVDKWCEGCRIQYDPGSDFIFNWIQKNALWFREEWDNTICKDCMSWKDCGYKLARTCISYSKDNE